MGKLSLSKTACIVFLFCAATPITSPAQFLTTLYSFCSLPHCVDGATPYRGSLLQATDGNFYGTTGGGGPNGGGTIFKITSRGRLTTIYSFCSQLDCADGYLPSVALVQATDGNFYGTTLYGGTGNNCGSNRCGTVFKVTPSGTLTTLHSFCPQYPCTDGADPYAGLVQGTDGNFYGTTRYGGANNNCGNCGTVFGITPAGALTTLYSFGGPDGALPMAALVQATDGNFYGTTNGGGASSTGTVFKITPTGTLTTVYSFCAQPNCTDGAYPSAGLIQATDGNFYGTTGYGGGDRDEGTAFKMTPSGTLTTLYSFGGPDGALPMAALVQATDGNFYGTTVYGGASNNCYGGCGTVFQVTPSGTLTTLHSFCPQYPCTDGDRIYTGLVQGTDGNFYGTTYLGGANYSDCANGCGTVFSLPGPSLDPLQFVTLPPCRVVDTRGSNGSFGGPAVPGNTARSFPLSEGDNPCGIPSDAVAYSLNVTVVPITTLSYLTIWPTGERQPTVSTLNSLDGRLKANAVIIRGGSPSGSVNVFVTNTTNVVLDINGYFIPGNASTLAFYPLTPCRVADTRHPGGPLGGPYLQGGQERDFPVLESNCGLPSNAAAYSMNFTVIPKTSRGVAYLTVWSQGSSRPLVSTLNDLVNTVVANAAIVPAGMGGGVATYASDDTELVIDVNGYFGLPEGGGLQFYALTPCRVIDTRQVGNGQAFTGELTVDVVDSACGPPASSQGYVFNATVLPQGSLSYLTLWPDSQGQPGVSTLNALDGSITSNMAIVSNVNGKIDAYAAGLTQLILDITGYFAP